VACPISVFAFADEEKQQRDEGDPGESEQARPHHERDDAALSEHHDAGYCRKHPEGCDDSAIPTHNGCLPIVTAFVR